MPGPDPIPFLKMHGCANDYLFLDAIEHPDLADISAKIVRAMCHRRTGLGADGVIILTRDAGTWSARVVNADGSDGGMCGNGLRCAARLLQDHHGAPSDFEVRMGGRTIAARVGHDVVSLAMGRVRLGATPMGIDMDILGAGGGEPLYTLEGLRIGFGDIGNPHMVILSDSEPTEADLARFGPRYERRPAFPQGMNVHLVHIKTPLQIVMRSHERGAGPTQACGSGACVVAALLVAAGLASSNVEVRVPGGVLHVRVEEDANCTLTGPVAYVCEGTFLQ
ncbi:MAG: diaminopimelate epimerase [Phycisphaerales bacterium]|nr:diaminopimelate epimerase [Phycisphaerales bacterium]